MAISPMSLRSSGRTANQQVIAIEKSGRGIFAVGPASSRAVTPLTGSDRYRSGLSPGRTRWQSRVVTGDGSIIARCGFARNIPAVGPGLRGECADARRRNAGTSVDVERAGRRGACIGGHYEVPRHDTAFLRHRWSCKHGRSDQSSRYKFQLSHSISPSDIRSRQGLASQRR
jgi:hypothetical protein